MTEVETIAHRIERLSPEDLSVLRAWFAAFDAKIWDRRIESDARAGKLDALAEKALHAHASGAATKL